MKNMQKLSSKHITLIETNMSIVAIILNY